MKKKGNKEDPGNHVPSNSGTASKSTGKRHGSRSGAGKSGRVKNSNSSAQKPDPSASTFQQYKGYVADWMGRSGRAGAKQKRKSKKRNRGPMRRHRRGTAKSGKRKARRSRKSKKRRKRPTRSRRKGLFRST